MPSIPCPIAVCALFLAAALPAAPLPPAGSVPVAASGQARAAIVVGAGAGDSVRFAAVTLQQYFHAMSGADIAIVPPARAASRPPGEAWILVGAPDQNPLVQQALYSCALAFDGLSGDAFVLKTCLLGQRPVVVAGGHGDAATMYAVFELAQCLGVTFRLTGDIVPERRSSLSIPTLDLRLTPALARRGFLLEASHHPSITMLSYQDYRRLLDQMAKMKLNFLEFWWFAYQPWLNYSYRGESKLIGDMSDKNTGFLNSLYEGYGSRTTDDVSIGKDKFPRRRLAPPELSTVETPEQAFAAAQDLLLRIIHYAKSRHVDMWLVDEMAALPPNLGRYTERIGEVPFNGVFGALPHPLDPVNREIQVNRLKALVETYPEAQGYFLNFSEVYFPVNTAPHKDFFATHSAEFQPLNDLLAPWIDWQNVGRQVMIESNVAYYDLFKFLLDQRPAIAPHAKLGLMTVGRGYLMPLLDKMIPKDVPFTTFDSGGRCGWTPNGMPMSYFGGLGSRERIDTPYVDDDCEMMGLQFNLGVYSRKDRIFTDGVKNGLTGVAGWMSRIRGTEHNTGFLAQASWQPDLTPDEFYRDYSARLFGAAAAPAAYQAFLTLEENEAFLSQELRPLTGTLGCCGASAEASLGRRYARQENPYDGPTGGDWRWYVKESPAIIARYEGSIPRLEKALVQLRAAQAAVAPRGRYELAYLINRTETYRDSMRAHITVRRAIMAFDQAFKDRPQLSHDQFVAALEASLRQFDDACRQSRSLTARYAEVIDHPADMEVLYHLNVSTVLSWDLTRQWLRNIVNFHAGQPYTQHVPFERVFPLDVRIARIPK